MSIIVISEVLLFELIMFLLKDNMWKSDVESGNFDPIRDLSASVIAAKRTEILSPFSLVIYPGGYIPNKRVRDLAKSIPSRTSDTVVNDFVKHHQSPKFFISDKSTEKQICLDFFHAICQRLIALFEDTANIVYKYDTPTSLTDYFAKKSAHPQPLFMTGGAITLCSEVKGHNTSTYRCFSQVFMCCANAALALRRKGLPLEQCVVPGVCFAGDGFRFVAVYLIEPSWPVMVVLSDSLDIQGDSLKIVGDWLIRLIDFALATSKMLS